MPAFSFEKIIPLRPPAPSEKADETFLERFAFSKWRWTVYVPIALLLAFVLLYPFAKLFLNWPQYTDLIARHRPVSAVDVTIVNENEVKRE